LFCFCLYALGWLVGWLFLVWFGFGFGFGLIRLVCLLFVLFSVKKKRKKNDTGSAASFLYLFGLSNKKKYPTEFRDT
jgi:hypothetical protein